MDRSKKVLSSPIEFLGKVIFPGTRARVEMPIARLPTQTLVSLPIIVIHGKYKGPTLGLSAAIHGDEVVGVEIIRRVLGRVKESRLAGTVFATPVVNVFAFINESRYFSDRRDLNRVFPGSERGSLASRLANLFLRDIVKRCEYFVDFHAASLGRINYPHLRVLKDTPELVRLAKLFDIDLVLQNRPVSGSLRSAAAKTGCKMLLFEGGEALRFDRDSLEKGLHGVDSLMRGLGMLPTKKEAKKIREKKTVFANESIWVRSPRSGLFRSIVNLGQWVEPETELGSIYDISGEKLRTIVTKHGGCVIGMTINPMIHQGDALVHIAFHSP